MDKNFSLVLKSLRINKGYTQKQLARLLDLGQTTIANYENGTRIPDINTIGKIADLFQVTLDYLFGRNAYIDEIHEDYQNIESNYLDLSFKYYMNCLLNGDKQGARGICLSLLQRGMKINEIYQDIIESSLVKVGVLWEKGTVDIWKEHLISEICLDIMRSLNVKFNPSKSSSKKIIALTPGPEIHNIGLRMVCDVFDHKGWNSIFLGSNVPTLSVLDAIAKNKPNVLALSITMPSHIESANHLIEAIRQIYSKDSLSIIIGGSALNGIENIVQFTNADYYFTNLDDLISQMDTL